MSDVNKYKLALQGYARRCVATDEQRAEIVFLALLPVFQEYLIAGLSLDAAFLATIQKVKR